MKPKLIKNNQDYEMALKHIESLMEEPESTAINEEIELFTSLVWLYEEKTFPVDLPDPIDAIVFVMDQKGLTRKDLIPILGSQGKVSEILNRKRPLSLSMIRKVHEELKIPAEILLKDTQQNQVPQRRFAYEDFPVSDMFKLGYFPDYQIISQVKEYFEEAMSTLFSRFGGKTPQPLYCKQSKGNPNLDVLLAWQAHILQKYGADEVDDFFLDALDDSFFNELLSFSMYPKGPLLVKDYLYAYGIRFVVEPHLPKTYVDGAAFASHDGKPLVVLSLRHDRVDNFWFTLLHELAHVVKHLYGGADDRAFFDDTSSNPKECESLLEQEANDFAMEYLIPATRVDVQALGDASAWSPSKILATAKELKRSPAILAGRIRYETGNYGLFSEMLGAKGLKCLFT